MLETQQENAMDTQPVQTAEQWFIAAAQAAIGKTMDDNWTPGKRFNNSPPLLFSTSQATFTGRITTENGIVSFPYPAQLDKLITSTANSVAKLNSAINNQQQAAKKLLDHLLAGTLPKDVENAVRLPDALTEAMAAPLATFRTALLQHKLKECMEKIDEIFAKMHLVIHTTFSDIIALTQTIGTSGSGYEHLPLVFKSGDENWPLIRTTICYHKMFTQVGEVITRFRLRSLAHERAQAAKAAKAAEAKLITDTKKAETITGETLDLELKKIRLAMTKNGKPSGSSAKKTPQQKGNGSNANKQEKGNGSGKSKGKGKSKVSPEKDG